MIKSLQSLSDSSPMFQAQDLFATIPFRAFPYPAKLSKSFRSNFLKQRISRLEIIFRQIVLNGTKHGFQPKEMNTQSLPKLNVKPTHIFQSSINSEIKKEKMGVPALYIYDFDGTLSATDANNLHQSKTALRPVVDHAEKKIKKGQKVVVLSNSRISYLKKHLPGILDTRAWHSDFDFYKNTKAPPQLQPLKEVSTKVDLVVGSHNSCFPIRGILENLNTDNIELRTSQWKSIYQQKDPTLDFLDTTLNKHHVVENMKPRDYVDSLFEKSHKKDSIQKLQDVYFHLFKTQYKPYADRLFYGLNQAKLNEFRKIVVVGDNPQSDGGLAVDLKQRTSVPVSFIWVQNPIATKQSEEVKTTHIGAKYKGDNLFTLVKQLIPKALKQNPLVRLEQNALDILFKRFWGHNDIVE